LSPEEAFAAFAFAAACAGQKRTAVGIKKNDQGDWIFFEA